MTSHARAGLLALFLVASVAAANYLTSAYGLIPAGFGLLVTAGTYAAGLSLGLRDALHEAGGYRWVLAAIAAGVAVSLAVGDGRIALASAAAFALAEVLDLAVYTPLRRHGWRRAVVASNAAGAVADTVAFLSLAGFPLTFAAVGGQLLVKAVWMTLLALAVGQVASALRARVA
jgi:queuosine precursor transporter